MSDETDDAAEICMASPVDMAGTHCDCWWEGLNCHWCHPDLNRTFHDGVVSR